MALVEIEREGAGMVIGDSFCNYGELEIVARMV